MYKLFDYDETEFPFRQIIESKLESSIENLHEKYNFDNSLCDFTGGSVNNNIEKNGISIFEFTESLYPKLLNDYFFLNVWNRFSKFVKEIVFENQKIYIQKTPSIRIFPSNSKLQYVNKTTEIFGRENNWHIDNDEPFWHPPFEKNMWMSLIDTDIDNSLYIEDDVIKPIYAKKNQLLMFDGVHHGAFVHNCSKKTRISIDFKVVPFEDYDVNLLSDKLIKKRGQFYKQTEWYSDKHYYKVI